MRSRQESVSTAYLTHFQSQSMTARSFSSTHRCSCALPSFCFVLPKRPHTLLTKKLPQARSQKRLGAAQALAHPYFAELHDPDDRIPVHTAAQHAQNRIVHIPAWNVGCVHASNSSNVSSCQLKCEKNADASYMVPFHEVAQGCCGYKGAVVPGTEQSLGDIKLLSAGNLVTGLRRIHKPKP